MIGTSNRNIFFVLAPFSHFSIYTVYQMKGGDTMPVTTDFISNKVQVRSNYGLVDGKELIKSKTYSNLKASAVNDDIYAVAEALASMQEPAMEEVIKIESTLLIPGV